MRTLIYQSRVVNYTFSVIHVGATLLIILSMDVPVMFSDLTNPLTTVVTHTGVSEYKWPTFLTLNMFVN